MLRILVVDDEVVERNGIRFLLEKAGWPVAIREAENGEQALEYLNREPVDILITDLKMPFVDGLELSAAARKLYPELYIVVITAYGEFEYARRAIHIGVNEFLLKPVNPEDFRTTMDGIIHKLTSAPEKAPGVMNKLGKLEKDILERVPESRHEIELVVHYIFNHYGEEFGLEDLAAHVYMTPSYLSSVFKREMKVGVNVFLKNYRMEKAKEMLEQTNMKIKEIGNRVGYCNTSYFCKSFRDCYGVTPEQYRQR